MNFFFGMQIWGSWGAGFEHIFLENLATFFFFNGNHESYDLKMKKQNKCLMHIYAAVPIDIGILLSIVNS
jgi:hypothetical protein